MRLELDQKQLVETLEKGGFTVYWQGRLPNDLGTQIRLKTGQIVNRYDTGTVNVQGRDVAPVRELLGLRRAVSNRPSGECLSPG